MGSLYGHHMDTYNAVRARTILSLRKQTKADLSLSYLFPTIPIPFPVPSQGCPGADICGNSQGAAGRAEPCPGEALPAPGAESASAQVCSGLAPPGPAQGRALGHGTCRAEPLEQRGMDLVTAGVVSSAPGEGFLLVFLLLVQSLGLFFSMECRERFILGVRCSCSVCAEHTDTALLPQNSPCFPPPHSDMSCSCASYCNQK